jgi:hypothetical protein
VSTAGQTALDLNANLASPPFTGTVGGITTAMVGLSSADNTSDASNPVSTAGQTALDLKANLASPTFTGTVGGITKAMVGLTSADNTSDASKPVSSAGQEEPVGPSWTQSSEEVEIRVQIPAAAKKKDLNVKVQSNKLQISFKNANLLEDFDAANDVDRRIIFGSGAELAHRIDVDLSTWNLDSVGADRQYVVFSLGKQDGATWAQPLK